MKVGAGGELSQELLHQQGLLRGSVTAVPWAAVPAPGRQEALELPST